MGQRPFDAALKGAGQIGFTIISITFSLIAVFIPLLFMGGIIGRLFREFAVTVSVAVVASAAISLTLTPVLCSLFLKEQALHQPGRLNRVLESGFDWMLRAYDRGLGFVFRHQLPTLLSTLALIVADRLSLRDDPERLFSGAGYRLHLSARPMRARTSRSLAMAKLTHQIVDIVRKDPDVSGCFLLYRRLRLQPDREYRPDVHPAEAARPALLDLEPDHPAPAPESRRGPGRQVLYAVGPGHQRRRPAQPHPLSIHADRHRPGRAQSLGADPRAGDEEAAGAAGRRLRPAGRGAAYRASRSTATPPRGWASRRR